MESKEPKLKLLSCRTTVAIIAFFALNLVLAMNFTREKGTLTAEQIKSSTNERMQEGNWVWWITRDYLVNGQDSDVVFMGSSQMGSALYSAEAKYLMEPVDTVTYRRSRMAESVLATKFGGKPKVFNMSFGGAMASDQYMLANSLFNDQHKPKLVVIGVNPRDFMDNTFPSASATDAFRYLSPYVDLGDLNGCAFSDGFAWMDWQMNQLLPIKGIGEQLRNSMPEIEKQLLSWTGEAKVVDLGDDSGDAQVEQTEKKADATAGNADALKAIYGDQGKVKPGVWKVVAATWGIFQDNTREYQNRYKNSNPPIYAGQKKFFEEFLAHCKRENIKVLVVGMPSLWPNRALLPASFWTEFKGSIASLTTKYGATWVPLYEDARFKNTDYLDTVHLNPMGGDKIVEAVTAAIADHKQLTAAIAEPAQVAGRRPPRIEPPIF